MNYVYVILDKDTITITTRQPACGVCFRWKGEALTTERVQKLQENYPNRVIILSETVVGLIQENDKRAAMPITRGEKKPSDPNSNRLKFDLKKVGRKTYLERETKLQQDHIARHRAPLPTDRDRTAAESSDSSTNPQIEFFKKHRSEILMSEEVRKAISKVALDVYYEENGCYPISNGKISIEVLKAVFPESFR